MRPGGGQHLTDDTLFRLAEGAERMKEPAHLAECAECRERLEGVRAMGHKLRSFRLPPDVESAEECPGPLEWALLAAGQAEDRREAMLAHASGCGRCAALLRAAQDEDEDEERAAGKADVRTPRPLWRRWGAIAAALAILSVPAGYRLLRENPEELLAKAYSESRPFLPRVPGALHAPLAQVRAGEPALNRPALIRAAGILTSRTGDDRYLLWKGTYELLTLRTDDAIQTLRRAERTAGDEARLILAVALFQRGSATGRREDLLEALDLQAAAVQKANAPLETRFNLALTYEALQMNDQAMAAWRDYVQRDGGSGWGTEAKRRLSELEELIRNRQGAERRLRRDAADFLLAGGMPELALPAFWMEWYPALERAESVFALARRMQTEHGDWMVADALKLPFTPSGARLLAEAMQANREGRRQDRAEQLAAEAESEATGAGNRMTALRARLERVYALHLQYRGAECLQEAQRLEEEIEGTSYVWMQAQVKLEMANCLAMGNAYGAAIRATEEARGIAAGAGLAELEMRAAGLESGFRVQAGDFTGVLTRDGEFLARYWSAPYAPNRAQQFFSNAVRGAEALGFDRAAYELAKARLEVMAPGGSSLLQARGHAQLALLAAKVGDEGEAQAQMSEAARQFRELAGEDGPMRRDAEVDLVHARLLLRMTPGESDEMTKLEGVMATPPTVDSEMRASALAAIIRPVQARAYVERAIDHQQSRLKDLRGWARHQAMEQSIGLYRWKASLLAEQDRWEEALDAWLQRSGSTRELPRETIVFLTLSDGVARWWWGEGGLRWVRLQLGERELRRTAEVLRRMLSERGSAVDEIDRLAARLREELLGGWRGKGKLRIVADEALAGMPWMLVAGEGTEVSVERTLRFRRDSGVRMQRVAVMAPAAGFEHAALYPNMPDAVAESAEVAGRFEEARVYRGADATEAAMRPWGDVLHFSGHASAAGLVLAGRDGFALYGAGQAAGADWSGTDLVCLAACATAPGGRANRGSGALAEAFLAGGAGAVVATLWNVDATATRALMGAFYQRLRAGDTAGAALRNAAQTVKENAAFRHPYFWAGFQIFY